MTGFTQITASNIRTISGIPLTGHVTFTGPVNNAGTPISALADGGPIICGTVTFLVSNGSIVGTTTAPTDATQARVADSSLATPRNIGYTVAFYDSAKGLISRPGYLCVQPSGPTWSLDTYVPVQSPLVTVQPGPPGTAGLSVYQLYQQTGGTLDLVDWIASLHGSLTPQELAATVGSLLADSLPSGRQLFDFTAVKYGYIGFNSGTVGNQLDLRTASSDPSGDNVNTYVAKVAVAGLSFVTANVDLQAYDSVAAAFTDIDGKVLAFIAGTAAPAKGTPIAVPAGAIELYAQCKGPGAGGVDKTQAAFAAGSTLPVWSPFDRSAATAALIPSNAAIVNAIGLVLDSALAPDRQRFDWTKVPGGYLGTQTQVGGAPVIDNPGADDVNTYLAVMDVAGLAFITANTPLQAYDSIAYVFLGLDGNVIARVPLPSGGIAAGTPIAVQPGAAKMIAQCKGAGAGGVAKQAAAFKAGSTLPTWSPYDAGATALAAVPSTSSIISLAGKVAAGMLQPNRQLVDWRQVPGGYLGFDSTPGNPVDVRNPGADDGDTYVVVMDVAGLSFVTGNTALNAYDSVAWCVTGIDGLVLTSNPLPSGGIPAGTPLPIPPGGVLLYAQCHTADNAGGVAKQDVVFKGGTSLPAWSPFDEEFAVDPYLRPYAYYPTNLGSTLNNALNRGGQAPYRQARYGMLADSYGAFDSPNFFNIVADYIGAARTFDGSLSGRAFANWKDAGTSGVLNQAAAQNLDILFIELGTNQNSTAGFGTIDDAPGYGPTFSLCAQMVDMIGTLLNWNPSLRIVGCTPTQTSRFNTSTSATDLTGNADLNAPNAISLAICKTIADTQKMVYGHFGIPVVDWHYESGIVPLSPAAGQALYATRTNDQSTDWVHPSPFARATRLYPLVKRKLLQTACI